MDLQKVWLSCIIGLISTSCWFPVRSRLQIHPHPTIYQNWCSIAPSTRLAKQLMKNCGWSSSCKDRRRMCCWPFRFSLKHIIFPCLTNTFPSFWHRVNFNVCLLQSHMLCNCRLPSPLPQSDTVCLDCHLKHVSLPSFMYLKNGNKTQNQVFPCTYAPILGLFSFFQHFATLNLFINVFILHWKCCKLWSNSYLSIWNHS